MSNFLLAIISSYLIVFDTLVLFVDASSLIKERPPKASMPRASPKFEHPPSWFESVESVGTWTIYGQWFTQEISPKPVKSYKKIRKISGSNDFWDFISPADLLKISRTDISIFRPGWEPNFSLLKKNETGHILSHYIDPSIFNVKLSRNARNKLNSLPLSTNSLDYFHVFDSLIDAAIKNSSLKQSHDESNINSLLSDIIGFMFKRLFGRTYILIFFEGKHTCPINLLKREIKIFVESLSTDVKLNRSFLYKLNNFSKTITCGRFYVTPSLHSEFESESKLVQSQDHLKSPRYPSFVSLADDIIPSRFEPENGNDCMIIDNTLIIHPDSPDLSEFCDALENPISPGPGSVSSPHSSEYSSPFNPIHEEDKFNRIEEIVLMSESLDIPHSVSSNSIDSFGSDIKNFGDSLNDEYDRKLIEEEELNLEFIKSTLEMSRSNPVFILDKIISDYIAFHQRFNSHSLNSPANLFPPFIPKEFRVQEEKDQFIQDILFESIFTQNLNLEGPKSKDILKHFEKVLGQIENLIN